MSRIAELQREELDADGQQLYDEILAAPKKRSTIKCSRRFARKKTKTSSEAASALATTNGNHFAVAIATERRSPTVAA